MVCCMKNNMWYYLFAFLMIKLESMISNLWLQMM